MVLEIPGSILGKDEGLFKKSPIDGEVDKYEGSKKVPSTDNDTDTQTKEFWATPGAVFEGNIGNWFRARCWDSTANMNFKVPHDFTSITSAEVLVIHQVNNATTDIDIESSYGVKGEAHNAHGESDTVTTYNFTANEIDSIDVSGILTGIAANNYVRLAITSNET